MPTSHANPKTSPSRITGIVRLDGELYRITTRPELLFVDAGAWFESQRRRHLDFAADARTEGDLEAASQMQEVADQLDGLIKAGQPLNQDGMWPQIRNRALMMPWSPHRDDSLRQYARSLIEFSEPSSSDAQALFDLRVSDGESELRLHESLAGQARYAHPLRVCPLDDEDARKTGGRA